MLNFGALELASLQWIDELSTDGIVKEIAIDLKLSRKIALIQTLIKRSNVSAARQKSMIALWDAVSVLSQTRNTIAHNPLLFRYFHGKLQAGVINTKKMKGVGPYKLRPIKFEDVRSASSRAAHLVEELVKAFGWLPNGGKK